MRPTSSGKARGLVLLPWPERSGLTLDGANIMTTKKTLDWSSRLALSGGAALAATCIAALAMTFQVF